MNMNADKFRELAYGVVYLAECQAATLQLAQRTIDGQASCGLNIEPGVHIGVDSVGRHEWVLARFLDLIRDHDLIEHAHIAPHVLEDTFGRVHRELSKSPLQLLAEASEGPSSNIGDV